MSLSLKNEKIERERRKQRLEQEKKEKERRDNLKKEIGHKQVMADKRVIINSCFYILINLIGDKTTSIYRKQLGPREVIISSLTLKVRPMILRLPMPSCLC